ncbi:MAG: sensor histidine kinase, partial [Bacteroidia bacterium]|nr:sensor histidine kinase [Bacteroidia bacterium]
VILFLLFITLTSHCGFSQIVEKGSISFPEKGLKQHDVMKLAGPWQFYYGKHLSAKEMENLPTEDKYYLSSPSNWIKLKRHGESTPAIGIATYYLKIIIDSSSNHSPRDYAFRVGDITSAYSMFVNDLPVMSAGIASTTANNFKPGYYPHVGFTHNNYDTLNVILHVSNFFYPHFSGISRPILFGQEKDINRLQLQTTGLSIFLMCVFGILFFFEFMVFLGNPKDRSNLLVSLLAFLILVKMLLDNEMTIFHLFPNFNYYLGYRFWLFTLMTIPILFSLIKWFFQEETHRHATTVIYLTYGLLGISIFILPLPFLLEHLKIAIYFSIACIVYISYVLIRALINRRKYALTHFLSFSVAMGCILYDLIMITDPNKVNFISQFGIALYLLTLTSIILIRFLQAHKLSLKLTKELEETNQSLEAMVEERTKELQLTNSKLEKINNQKNFILATTTHDLKNSFNILNNCSDIMVEDVTLTQDQRAYAGLIQEASHNGYRVLQNILSWARMQITDYSETNVIQDLRGLAVMEIDTFKNQLKDKDLRTRVEVDNSLQFLCDKEQIYSICRNLLSNAIKFSQPGGEIVISNALVDDRVEIRFHDNGIGMEPKMVETLFDNTMDNKRPGTAGEIGSGLGMIIVKELVESNNGSISCISEPGKGTDFMVRFPRIIE